MRFDISIYLAIAFVISLVSAAIAIPIIISFCKKYGYFDQPDTRKLHHIAVPRLGGLAFLPCMAVAFATSLLVYYSDTSTPLNLHVSSSIMILGATGIYVMGLVDDINDLSAFLKFCLMLVATALMPLCDLLIRDLHGFFGIHELPLWAAYVFTVLTIMTIVNAANLIDGIDGLASGYAIIVLTFLVYRFIDLRAPIFALMAVSLIGAVLTFFIFNFFGHVGKKKIFMGDAGSLILGYVMAYLAIKCLTLSERDIYQQGNPILLSYSLFIVPVFDLLRVALTRVVSGQSMFRADKRHIHHVLMSLGLTMRQTTAIILMIVVVFVIMNQFLQTAGLDITAIFLIDVAVFAALFAAMHLIRQRQQSTLHRH